MGPALLIVWAFTAQGVATTVPYAFKQLIQCLEAGPSMVEMLPKTERMIGPWNWRCIEVSRDEVT